MNWVKKIIALTLLGGSLAFAVFIIRGNTQQQIVPITTSNKTAFEELSTIIGIANQNNVTREIAAKFAEELGPINSAEDLKNLEPDKLVNQILQESISSFDPASLIPEIRISDFKTTAKHDKAAKDGYFKSLSAVTQAEMSKTGEASLGRNAEDFSAIASAYDKIAANLYNLVVPEPLVDFHKELVKIFILQKNIFDNLANYETDPLKAMAVLPLLEESANQLAILWNQYAE